MNKQGNRANPKGGIEWTHILGPLTGFTANPVRGCEHECQWRMPDGTVVICYAKAQKERMSGKGSFEKITFHPDILDQIRSRKEPAGIFIDSMSDLFGENVNEAWISIVLDCAWDCPQHIFFTLTKNPRRLRDFRFSPNTLVGLSAPPTFMYGKELSHEAQRTWFRKGLEWLTNCAAENVWLSLEPLAIDVSDLIAPHQERIRWAVIGAASDGARTYQPERETFANTLRVLDTMPVFFKGNVDRQLADEIAGGWKEEFPDLESSIRENPRLKSS